MTLEESIKIAIKYLDDDLFKSLSIKYALDEKLNGFSVDRNNNDVKIIYSKKCELFRALSLIKEKRNETNYHISLTPKFETNGLMVDCSRNGVVKVNEVKHLILIEALMGENRLLLYTEDTYEMKQYPYFGYLRGAYTEEEIKELVSYGEDFGVELVPCIQTLAHLEKFLRWDINDPIRENRNNLFIGNEDTYKLIEEMIKTSRKCFKTHAIHVGMDESFDFGLGRYLAKFGFRDRIELYSEHLSRVIDICKKYDFEPMIWSDMYFRLNDKNHDYYGRNPLPKTTINLIPKDVQLVYWDYYHDNVEFYDSMIRNHLETNRKTIFAGGSWRWSGFATSLHNSYKFNMAALKSCVSHGVKDVFLTAWGDNGNESSVYSSLLCLAQYSAFSYYNEDIEQHIESMLNVIVGESIESMLSLDLPNMPDKRVLAAPYNPSKFFFYQDILLGLFDSQRKPQFSKNYAEFAQVLEKNSKKSKKFAYMFNTLSDLCKVLEIKVDVGVNLRQAYKSKNKKEMDNIANKVLPELLNRIETFRNSLEIQWNHENKIFGYEVLDGRIGFLTARVNFAIKVVNQYLRGELKELQELEKDILPYGGNDYEISWNEWTSTVSAGSL
ncbi:MAG: beta-N-acetylhexosaminidase [Bacilli bacterium]|nr:beta-N-acetylhexosaminidase [Bacilli bacterium]